MRLPQSLEELTKLGYVYEGGSTCRGCQAWILWYRTPNDKLLPMNQDGIPHWATCPSARDFKKRKQPQ